MSDMRRLTIYIPKEIDRQILELRKNDRFVDCSYSELVQLALKVGFQTLIK